MSMDILVMGKCNVIMISLYRTMWQDKTKQCVIVGKTRVKQMAVFHKCTENYVNRQIRCHGSLNLTLYRFCLRCIHYRHLLCLHCTKLIYALSKSSNIKVMRLN